MSAGLSQELTADLARAWNFMLSEKDNLDRALHDRQAAEDRAEKARLAIQKHGDLIQNLLKVGKSTP
jgi:hypothetical protein